MRTSPGARANLRLALSKLRQRLPDVIQADAETIGWNPAASIQVDALSLLKAAETAGTTLKTEVASSPLPPIPVLGLDVRL